MIRSQTEKPEGTPIHRIPSRRVIAFGKIFWTILIRFIGFFGILAGLIFIGYEIYRFQSDNPPVWIELIMPFFLAIMGIIASWLVLLLRQLGRIMLTIELLIIDLLLLYQLFSGFESMNFNGKILSLAILLGSILIVITLYLKSSAKVFQK